MVDFTNSSLSLPVGRDAAALCAAKNVRGTFFT
jgi:hypothetical protein